MANVLVIDGRPDAGPGLGHALADAYSDGARGSGHETRLLRLADINMTFLRSAQDFATPPTDPALLAARDDIVWAEHLVIVFPLWLGGAPAYLRAFLEHMARAGFLVDMTAKSWTPKLKGKSARLIVTMGMPSLAYWLIFGAFGVRGIARSVLGFAGAGPVRLHLIGGVEASADVQARRLARVRELGRRAV